MSFSETWMTKVTRKTYEVRWLKGASTVAMQADIMKVPDKAVLESIDADDDEIVLTFVKEVEDYSGNTRTPSEVS